MGDYVHGYSTQEAGRLQDQAATLADLLHHDSVFAPGSRVLEVGCGVGAQTVVLAARNPEVAFTSVDVSPESLAQARERVAAAKLTNVTLTVADLWHLPYPAGSFDAVFVCFVLEHLADPAAALARLVPLLRPGGELTAIEGDHGSALFHPDSAAAHRNIQCLVDLQSEAGGDALIGRRLQPLLSAAGLCDGRVSPRFVYADETRPEWVEGFTRRTFNAMVEGVHEQAVARGLSDEATWAEGRRALDRTAEPGGVFCYTFFKATGRR